MKAKPAASTAAAKKRKLDLPKHRTFRLSKKKLRQHRRLPGAFRLLKQTVSILASNKRWFLGLATINGLVTFVFIQGFGSSFSLVEFKNNLDETIGAANSTDRSLALFGYLLATAGASSSQGAEVYQVFLLLFTSLATIWGVRQILAGVSPGIRDSFYKGMYPLVPFGLLLFIIGLQLVPLLLGNLMYSTVIQNGLAATAIEKVLWLLLFILLALLSGYMVLSSFFALYISTLPDMTPFKALRSARELVLHRRFAVALRIIVLPLVLGLLGIIVFMPLLIFALPAAEILFVAATSLSLVVFHTYMYLLYRSLL